MYERFTDRARQTMQKANQAAQRFNHEYVGTEHILMGLTMTEGVAYNILQDWAKAKGVSLHDIPAEIDKIVQRGPDMVTMGKLPQTPRAKKVIEYAIEEARKMNHNYVGSEHLLLGLIREGDGVAAQILRNFGGGLDYDTTVELLVGIIGESKTKRMPVVPPVPLDRTYVLHFLQKILNAAKAGKPHAQIVLLAQDAIDNLT